MADGACILISNIRLCREVLPSAAFSGATNSWVLLPSFATTLCFCTRGEAIIGSLIGAGLSSSKLLEGSSGLDFLGRSGLYPYVNPECEIISSLIIVCSYS